MNNKRKRRDHGAPAVRPQTSVIVTDRSNKLHSSWYQRPLTSTENNHSSVPLSANKIQRPVLVWITVCFGLFFLFLVCDIYLLQIYDFFNTSFCNDLKWRKNTSKWWGQSLWFFIFYLEIYSKCRPNISLSVFRISSFLGFNLFPLSLFFQDIINNSDVNCIYSIFKIANLITVLEQKW